MQRTPMISPFKPLAPKSIIPKKLVSILNVIGLRILDFESHMFSENTKEVAVKRLFDFVQPPTTEGILRALQFSLPSGIGEDELIHKISRRFKDISNSEKTQLREWLRDGGNLEAGDENSLDDYLKMLLGALPIYPVYGEENYNNLTRTKYLPPDGADASLLDNNFVMVRNRHDELMVQFLGVKTMELNIFYEKYLCPRFVHGSFSQDLRDVALLKMLDDLPLIMKNHESVEKISGMNIFPTREDQNKLVCARDLFDPEAPTLDGLLHDSMVPSDGFCQPARLAALRILGLRTSLTYDGVLHISRNVESMASSSTRSAISLGNKLLHFLDNDMTVKTLLKACRDKDNEGNENIVTTCDGVVESENEIEVVENFELDSTEGLFITSLIETSWLPINNGSNVRDNQSLFPPKMNQVSISAPTNTRPKDDQWLCSFRMDTLPVNLRSELLQQLFGWDKPIKVEVITLQLLALAQDFDSHSNLHLYRQKLASIVPQLYQILDSHFCTADVDQKQAIFSMLSESPWIYVGDCFVCSNQVAFECPENARPHLFSVPQELVCFKSLMEHCGVRDKFSADDFVKVLSGLASSLDGASASTKQLDLAIGIAKLLSRTSDEELDLVEKKSIYLPSYNKTMHRAVDMTFDDAPWLSSIVTGRTRAQRFVHKDIDNETCTKLGVKSLRLKLTSQSGLVKIPCPSVEALCQLHENRKLGLKEDCKAILDLIDVGEKYGSKSVSVLFDKRVHRSESLLHPMLEGAQGPAVIVCLFDLVLDVESILPMTSPAHYYSQSTKGHFGHPRFGSSICGAFRLADTVQILSGNQLMFFDPSGECFSDGGMSQETNAESPSDTGAAENAEIRPAISLKKDRPTGRRYFISNDFPNQFPDQLDPFLSLPFGIKESFSRSNNSQEKGLSFRGTVFRLPLRMENEASKICKQFFPEKRIDSLMKKMVDVSPTSFLFTYNLQNISVFEWKASDSRESRLNCSRLNSSPIARRNHIDALRSNTEWQKSNNKLEKLWKKTWIPLQSSLLLSVASVKSSDQEDEIVDTFLIHSLLAPNRLRDMACTEALSNLSLIPVVSLAVHLGKKKKNNILDIKPKGALFVGLNTLEKTALPFFVNAPLFINELSGRAILCKDDDSKFQSLFPRIREVEMKSTGEKRNLSLHVWNAQALKSAYNDLIPIVLKEVRDFVDRDLTLEKAHLYRYWPRLAHVTENSFVTPNIYNGLTDIKTPFYLTKRGFETIDKGLFLSDQKLKSRAANFFSVTFTIFTVPRVVGNDLEKIGAPIKTLKPSTARQYLKKSSVSQSLSRDPDTALELLEFCLSDIPLEDNDGSDFVGNRVYKELLNLCLVPLADGSVGTVGRKLIMATPEQQRMHPHLKYKLLNQKGALLLDPYFYLPGFIQSLNVEHVGPKVVAQNISPILPSEWEGKEFVLWRDQNRVAKINIDPRLS